MDVLDTVVLGNAIQTWLQALGLAVLTAVVLRALVPRVVRRVSRLARSTGTILDDTVMTAAGATKGFFYVVVGVYAGWPLVELQPSADTLLSRLLVTAVLIQVGIWLAAGYKHFLLRTRETRFADDREVATSFDLISLVGRAAVWLLILVFVLQAWGVQVTALITTLGIGGIAIALAVQSILSDLFASLSIIFDKPFLVGDFLAVGEFLGTVEAIGLKTTQLRSLSGEQLVFSNSDLLKSRIRNYGRMEERRATFSFGVVYETEPDLVEQIPTWVREIIEEEENTRFDRSHFKAFGQWSLDFETVYWLVVPDYNAYMDVQERINLALMRRLAERGVEFAYPTQLQYEIRLDRSSSREPAPESGGAPVDASERQD